MIGTTKNKLSPLQAVCWIVGSTFIFSFLAYHGLQIYFGKQSTGKKLREDSSISYIVQTGFQKEALHSDYLAELLGLSVDQPTPFASFDVQGAQEKLRKNAPVIQEANIKKIAPNMVYIDYTVRRPVALVGDFINAAVDREGYLFPLSPFFSPKNFPEFYLGKEESLEEMPSFQKPLQGRHFELALTLLSLLQQQEKEFDFFIQRIDVSKASAPSLGKREIVVIIETHGVSHFLRLSVKPKQFTQEIANYFQLYPTLIEEDASSKSAGKKQRVIDLRISQLAFIH